MARARINPAGAASLDAALTRFMLQTCERKRQNVARNAAEVSPAMGRRLGPKTYVRETQPQQFEVGIEHDELVGIVEFGAQRPWVIEPKKGTALKFTVQPSGSTVFAKRVTHPPLEAHHIIERGVMEPGL